MAEEAASSWSLLLDDMEASLSSDADNSEPWAAPTMPEPLPPHLRDRAERVFEAQQQAIAALTEDRTVVSRHLSALRTVPSHQSSDRSIYLDVVG